MLTGKPSSGARGVTLTMAASTMAVVAFAATPGAPAEFRLVDGAMVEGTVTHASERHLALRTRDGVRLVHREDITGVTVASTTGRVIGAFEDWRTGVYVIATPTGYVEVEDSEKIGSPGVVPIGEGGDATLDLFGAPAIADLPEDEFSVQIAPPDPLVGDATQAFDSGAEQAPGAGADENGPSTVMLGRVEEALEGGGGALAALADASIDAAPAPEPFSAVDEALSALAADSGAGADASASQVIDGGAAPNINTTPPDRPQGPFIVADPEAEISVVASADSGADADSEMRGMLSSLIFGETEVESDFGGADAGAVATMDLSEDLEAAAEIAEAAAEARAAEEVQLLVALAPVGDRVDDQDAGAEATAARTEQAPPDQPPSAEDAAIVDAQILNDDDIDVEGIEVTSIRGGDATKAANAELAQGELGGAPQDLLAIGGDGVKRRSVARTDLIERDFARDYQLALNGAYGDEAPATSCVRMIDLVEPPGSLSSDRIEPMAMIMINAGDFPLSLSAALVDDWYAAAGATATREAGPVEHSLLLAQSGAHLSRARRVVTMQADSEAKAMLALQDATADIGLTYTPPSLGAAEDKMEAVLVGFDAVAVATKPNSPVKSLSKRDLAALLTGMISDWSMIEPSWIGMPTLYLPPAGSESLRMVMKLVDVRRANPVSVRYVADAAQRVEAALADPNGVVIAPWSVVGENALPIGPEDGGVTPTLDTLRSEVYPMIAPVYLRMSPAKRHPASRAFADFLVGPRGQRVLYDLGLMPIAACDPSTCSLTAPGFEVARSRMTALSSGTYLRIANDEMVDGEVAAQFIFGPGVGPVSPELSEEMRTFIALYGGGDAATAVAAAVVARTGGLADDERRVAQIRGEGVALALRCAGMRVDRLVLDSSVAAHEDYLVDVVLQ